MYKKQAKKFSLPKSLLVFSAISAISYGGYVASDDGMAEVTPPTDIQENSEFRLSDSPLLWQDADLLDVKPIVPPAPRAVPIADMPLDTVIFDPTTREETVIPEVPSPEILDGTERSTPAYEGLLPVTPLENPRSVLGTDDRVQITNTTTFPWRTIARLRIKFPGSASIWGCSGALVDGFHILTAGHCVHDGSNWYEWIEVYPGQDESYTPYHMAWVTGARSYTGWTVDQSPDNDWALVTLDRNIGNHTGWMGRITGASSDSIYTSTANVSGYPCDKPAGSQWYDSDLGASATEYKHYYYMDTYGCQSGAPVWRYVDPSRWIMTVHAYGAGGTPPTNSGTRLNQDKYDRLISWLGDDVSSPPTDKPDLIDDGPAYSGFTPTSAYPGWSFSAWSDIRNVGTANSSGFWVSYYASTNTIISTADRLLGSVWVSGVNAFSWADANWNGNLPANIAPGSYYIGWIIDSTGTNSEFDETNNIAYEASPTLTVLQVSAPSSITATDGTYTNKVAVGWSSSTGATSYQLFRCTNSLTTSCGGAIYAGASTGYDDTGATPGVIYYYRAKACNGALCSALSGYNTGYILAPPTAPSSITATDGTYTDRVAASWSSSSGATSYQLYRCTTTSTASCGSAIYSGTSTSQDDTGATPGVTYYYRAKACNAAGCSAFSTYNPGYILAPPDTPSSITASDGTYTDKVAASWSSSSGATSYELYRCTTSSTASCGSAIYSGGRLSYDDTGAAPGVTYYYRAKACNAAGCSAFSGFDTGYILVPLSQVGVHRNNLFFLDLNGNHLWDAGIDTVFAFGAPTDLPVIGDWNGDGVDDVGVRRNNLFFLDLNGNRVWEPGIDTVFAFGASADLPVIGDWNGDGADDVGVRRNNLFYIDLNGNRVWEPGVDMVFAFGAPADLPVIGDWNGDGVDDVGVRRNNLFYIDINGNRVWEPGVDGVFAFGANTDLPVIGDWNGDGFDDFGVRRNNLFFLDLNGNLAWNVGIDGVFPFGVSSDTPLAGKW